jgi:uroporphyrinogen decarboxylase
LGVEIILTADDIADSSNLLVPPEVYREMILPHYARLVKYFKELGFYVIKHTDGNITELMEDIIGTGIDCFDPVDPSAGLDIGKFKEDYGSRICLKGNINCATTLVSGTRQEVIDETRTCIRKASFSGGHIISSSNTIHSGVNPENYRTFLEAVEEYGHYPLDMEKLGS